MEMQTSIAGIIRLKALAGRSRTACLSRMLPLLLLLALPGMVQAQYKYETDNGMITITGPSDFRGALIIPDIIEGKMVARIDDLAFSFCAGLTRVVIPDSVISIGEGAFYACASLTNVTIGSGVTNIGADAFERCPGLTVIAMDRLNPVYESAMEKKTSPFGLTQTVIAERSGNGGAGYVVRTAPPGEGSIQAGRHVGRHPG